VLGRDLLFDVGEQIIRTSKAEGVEVVFFTEVTNLTRYANSTIHQNLTLKQLRIGVRIRDGKRAAIAWSNRYDKDSIIELVRGLEEQLKSSPEDPELPPLLEKKETEDVEGVFSERTLNLSAEERAEMVMKLIREAKPYNAYGVFTTGGIEVAFVNSLGHRAYHRATDAHLTVNLMSETGSGWAQASAVNVDDINFDEVREKSLNKVKLSENPIELQPDTYTVVLEELAVSTLLEFMGWMGFSAKSYQEGKSFLIGKLGERLFDEKITLLDDPFYKGGFSLAFDMEGYPKKRLILVEKGVPKNLVYDRKTALRDKVESTGHAASPFGGFPYPLHMVLLPGEKTIEDLIGETERGLLITRLHYTNVVEPLSLTLTGMTRDGTFLIEDGKVTKGTKNLRFTESIVEALKEVEVGSPSTLVGETSWYETRFPAGVITPPLKISRFRFTGKTEF
jgi:predicted Zn-dependent protease